MGIRCSVWDVVCTKWEVEVGGRDGTAKKEVVDGVMGVASGRSGSRGLRSVTGSLRRLGSMVTRIVRTCRRRGTSDQGVSALARTLSTLRSTCRTIGSILLRRV